MPGGQSFNKNTSDIFVSQKTVTEDGSVGYQSDNSQTISSSDNNQTSIPATQNKNYGKKMEEDEMIGEVEFHQSPAMEVDSREIFLNQSYPVNDSPSIQGDGNVQRGYLIDKKSNDYHEKPSKEFYSSSPERIQASGLNREEVQGNSMETPIGMEESFLSKIRKEKGKQDHQITNYFFTKNRSGSHSSPTASLGVKKSPQKIISSLGEKIGDLFPLKKFIGLIVAVLLILVGGNYFLKSLTVKEEVQVRGVRAIDYIKKAKFNLEKKNFKAASTNLLSAKREFANAQEEFDQIGGQKLNFLRHIPFLSKVTSGQSIVILGENLTEAVYQLTEASNMLMGIENPLEKNYEKKGVSMTEILLDAQEKIHLAQGHLKKAEEVSKNIKVEDLPVEYREKIKLTKELLPLVNGALVENDNLVSIFLELFAHSGRRKFLIVFENNQEMRPTGGFIGSYGLLETELGYIENLKIEGIYNPDGQLEVNVVPPKPIQKISAVWSTHDANWWPDFPKSAKKLAWFYEKAGGPTVDGVIAVTPLLLERMLEITGPIEMPAYNKIITAKNFIREIQQQVEIDYDKEENKPKKILADMAPILFDKFFEIDNPKNIGRIFKTLLDSLEEKHILIYFRNPQKQFLVEKQGWAGKIQETKGDYLSVINTNINGFKSDGVIKETIKHQAEISDDGTIIDTVSVTRKHNGGYSQYDWWNKVNSDYMRIYVPQGSELLSVTGQTREINEERLAYDKLGFQRDPDVEKEENHMIIDNESGTRIYEDSGKTVFANWVYVSPQEEVTITYRYRLPFSLDVSQKKIGYSLLVQKQAGSINSDLILGVDYPADWQPQWTEPEAVIIERGNNRVTYKRHLDSDRFFGILFKK